MAYLKFHTLKIWLGSVLACGLLTSTLQAQLQIEYVAHAAFIVQSRSGVRVAVDPYNTNRWLGYSFPEDQEADAVFVTHPHYDHDANYNFGFQIPVFRKPGRYRVGDIEIRGLEGKHADPYGKEFGQTNTIWLIESGGARLLHVGDNGPLTEELVTQVGPIDALMLPIDGTYHILKKD